MALTITKKGSAYDVGLVVLFAAFLAVVIGREAFSPVLHTSALIVFVIAIGVLNTFREAHKESQMDEVQLAAASFGARWAVTIPLTLMLLTIFLPPLQSAALNLIETIHAVKGSPVPPLLRVFIMGMVLAVVLQLAGKSLIGIIWSWTKK